jgi:D-beta-D-heptose 7-phosphate kinase/D-beta-D-heptose 1-phosphate adenosyltransferase
MPPDVQLERLSEAIGRFSQAKVLVLGDVMLDRFIWGAVRRISPEAPVPVVEVSSETAMLGGAANVLHNLIALGGDALLCGLVGRDEPGRHVGSLLDELEVGGEGLLASPTRPTTVKTRVVAQSQQVVRVDREDRRPLAEEDLAGITDYLELQVPRVDAVIVSDYAKGVVAPQVTTRLAELCRRHRKLWTVDPKVPNMPLYRGASIVTPNHLEAALAAGLNLDLPDYVERAGAHLREAYGYQNVLVTQGERGMTLFSGQGAIHLPTTAKQVFDVTGAGDTVISTLTLGLVAGLEPVEAATLANFAAGVVVGEVGTSAVTGGRLSAVVQAAMGRPWGAG